VVALTFDDGYSATRTLQILWTLQQNRVNATFFPVAKAVAGDPTTWRTVAAAGFPIANHTDDHATLSGRCYSTQLSELTRWTSTIRSILGITPLPVMRPPGGSYDSNTRLAAAGAGQRDVVLWDVDTNDWQGPDAATISSRALAGRAGSIILMHLHAANTPAALPQIIAGFKARGFGFVTVGQLLGVGGAVPF
jgi:peptidoglycan/xylan/chitin deacetylase (PgdA/CDA1 family)